MNWYYASGSNQMGPFNDVDFERLVKDGTVKPDTLVWHEGMDNWQPQAVAMGRSVATGGKICSGCGKEFAEDELIQIDEAIVCANCKPLFIQKMREAGKVALVLEYAGFWIRAGAKVIDWIIVWVINLVITLVVGALSGASQDKFVALIMTGGASSGPNRDSDGVCYVLSRQIRCDPRQDGLRSQGGDARRRPYQLRTGFRTILWGNSKQRDLLHWLSDGSF